MNLLIYHSTFIQSAQQVNSQLSSQGPKTWGLGVFYWPFVNLIQFRCVAGRERKRRERERTREAEGEGEVKLGSPNCRLRYVHVDFRPLAASLAAVVWTTCMSYYVHLNPPTPKASLAPVADATA